MSTSLRAKDPVCGMDVEVSDSTPKTSYNGEDYYFCCPACLKSFEKDPGKYVNNHDAQDHQCAHHDDPNHHCEHHNHQH